MAETVALLMIAAAIALNLYRNRPSVSTVNESPQIADDDEVVTIEDMVLHDMTNEDDVYDIGVINFND
jgi:hypothetical protein